MAMNDNPKWQIGSYAENRFTHNEYRIDAIFGDDTYLLEGLGLISGENLNKYYIMSRVANWPPPIV